MPLEFIPLFNQVQSFKSRFQVLNRQFWGKLLNGFLAWLMFAASLISMDAKFQILVASPIRFRDFHVSCSLIWAASWLTDRRLNLFSRDSVLTLLQILLLFRVLNSLFCVDWFRFILFAMVSSLFSLTLIGVGLGWVVEVNLRTVFLS